MSLATLCDRCGVIARPAHSAYSVGLCPGAVGVGSRQPLSYDLCVPCADSLRKWLRETPPTNHESREGGA